MPHLDHLNSEILKVPAGQPLIEERDGSRKMFIIKSGKARVYKTYLGQRVTLAVLGKGEIFGELSFFDAEPRSASVEAMTDLEALVIDGDVAAEQIRTLPDWVVPIFKSVFQRFREMDHRITVLQSMNEFLKVSIGADSLPQTIYQELARFVKTIRLLYTRDTQAFGEVRSAALLKEMDDVLGNRQIGLRLFWKTLTESEIIESSLDANKGIVKVDIRKLDELNDYLLREAKSGRYLLLSHPAIAILRRIIAGGELALHTLEGYEGALDELQKVEIIRGKNSKGDLDFDPKVVSEAFRFQTVIKAFDHSGTNS